MVGKKKKTALYFFGELFLILRYQLSLAQQLLKILKTKEPGSKLRRKGELFFMRCVPLIRENVLHAQNMFSSCLENFLEALKVKNSPKSVEYSEAKLAL